METGDLVARADLGILPKRVVYLPSQVDTRFGSAKDWADHKFPNHLYLDNYDSLEYRERAEHIAALMGLECVTVSGDGKNLSYVRDIPNDKRCVILEPTRLWDNDIRGWTSDICQRLRGKIVIGRNSCADIEFRNSPTGFKVIAHPSTKFSLTRIYEDIDYVEYKSQ